MLTAEFSEFWLRSSPIFFGYLVFFSSLNPSGGFIWKLKKERQIQFFDEWLGTHQTGLIIQKEKTTRGMVNRFSGR